MTEGASHWITDAQFAKDIDEEGLLVSNQRIKRFLAGHSYDQFIIVASKGMGKTLLLRHKRKLIEKENKSILLIPRDATSDYVSLPATLPQELLALMDEDLFWEDLWKLAIAISALLNFPHRITPQERNAALSEIKQSDIPQQVANELQAAFQGMHVVQRTPSSVLDNLLNTSRRNLEKFRSSGLRMVWALFNKYVSSGCFVFIDSFDQALNRLFSNDLAKWCAAQRGLLKAAWELSRHNRHVKVYVTIRQEAYASFVDPEKINIRGSVLLLEYSKRDLEDIFSKAIKYYDKISTIETFVGFKTIYNGYLRVHEGVFDYIYRHTIGIPRWLMTLGAEISDSRPEKYTISDERERRVHQKRIAEIVNRVSSEELALDFLRNEMRLFFNSQNPESYIDNMLSKINSTVLSQANIARIATKVTCDPTWRGTQHPFCLLYNLGLLGCVARTGESTTRRQTFKKPYQFDWEFEHILPQDPKTFYLIHPCLHHLIQLTNFKFKYSRVKIGDGTVWSDKEDDVIEAEKLKLFISYAQEDALTVERIADEIERCLSEKSIIHDIWFDQWKMRAGKWHQDQMAQGLRNSDLLIFVVSQHSLGSNSVSLEWKAKFGEKISENTDSVFPFYIDKTSPDDLDIYLRHIHSYRYDNDPTKVARLVDDILNWKEEAPAVPVRKRVRRSSKT
ncbi:MAG TPA: toll/interleukin-1 receptor domain-containing protein [Xanthobacteraceae bacterium]|nr:toll/interleukin-1 receptor domain-containing protein [Xanthobacteraceae bacterium]